MRAINFLMAVALVIIFSLFCLSCVATSMSYQEIHQKHPMMLIADPDVTVYFFPFDIWIGGFTFYNNVYMFDSMYGADVYAERTCGLEHEYTHVVQYKKGWFLYKYFSYYLTVPWDSWSILHNANNPFESEAWRAEQACARLKRVILFP